LLVPGMEIVALTVHFDKANIANASNIFLHEHNITGLGSRVQLGTAAAASDVAGPVTLTLGSPVTVDVLKYYQLSYAGSDNDSVSGATLTARRVFPR